MAVIRATVTFPASTPPEPTPQLYEFQPRPGETGLPDPRYTVATTNLDSAPDILRLNDEPPRVTFNRDWQMYLKAINPNMTDNQVSQIMQTGRWGFNGTGIPGHANYIKGEELDKPDPFTDEDRTFALNVHAGEDDGDDVIITTFNGNLPPPPLSKISPQTHPWMYLILTVVHKDGHIAPFPNYAYVPGYEKYVTLFPLVSAHVIRYPKLHLKKASAWKIPF